MKSSLAALSKDQQLAFALLLDERQISALTKFATRTDFDAARFRGMLDDIWSRPGSKTDDQEKLTVRCRECYDHVPDPEDYTDHLTSAALDAALSICLTMSFLDDSDVNRVAEVAELANDTAYLYAPAQPDFGPVSKDDTAILEDPLVQRELTRQAEDLEFAAGLPAKFTRDTVQSVKDRASFAEDIIPI